MVVVAGQERDGGRCPGKGRYVETRLGRVYDDAFKAS